MAQRSHVQERQTSAWAAGLALFAGLMMIMIGSFQAIIGFAAILENEFYVVTPNYAFELDATAWGWIHLLLGIVLAVAGWGAIAGQVWARVIGITLAVLSAIANFFFIPYYPAWSIVIIALDVFVIWALSVYGRQAAADAGMR
jgi:hypothetical protein